MINPPTRPYTSEELQKVLKPLSNRKYRNSINSTSSDKAIKVKAPIDTENVDPIILKNSASKSEIKISEKPPIDPTIAGESQNNTSTVTIPKKSFVKRNGGWIIFGVGVVIVLGIFFFFENKKRKEAAAAAAAKKAA
jgi:hypothetical protein